MDLTVVLQGGTVNVRVAVLLHTHDGYLFEQSPKGYLYPVGGRIMLHESSEEAAYREVLEELAVPAHGLELCGVLENFFQRGTEEVHEFCFFYRGTVPHLDKLPEGFVALTVEEMESKDIRPSIVAKWTATAVGTVAHTVFRS